jgi:hypothetical protein
MISPLSKLPPIQSPKGDEFMRRTIPSIVFCLVCFLFTCGVRRASAQSSEGTVYYCTSSWSESVVYFSAPFQTDELARLNIQRAYLQFLRQKYSYPDDASSIVCSISQSLTSALTDRAGDEDSVKRTKHTVIETTWTYRGPVSAAQAAAPARAASPVASHEAATPPRASVPATNPVPASAATTSSGAGGPVSAMNICFSNPPPNPSDPNHKTQYLTAAFEVPVDAQRAPPALEPAFSAYLKATYQYASAGITCQPIWTVSDAQQAQKKIASGRDTAKLKMVNTGWRYGQPPLVPGQSGFDPLAQGPGGLDLSQHRLTTYFCILLAPGGTTMLPPPGPANQTAYISPIFQADWDSAAVNMAYDVYIRDHYVHDLNLSDLSTRCTAQSPAFQAMMYPRAGVSKLIGHKVPVDWTYTPAQAAAVHVAAAAAAAPVAPAPAPASSAPAPAPSASSSGGPFISCSTSGGAGIDTYLTGVFQTSHPVRHLPSGGNLVDQSVLDRFYAYLTQQGYKFRPGSNYGCDVQPTEAAAKAAQHKRAYEGGACSNCGKIVETGWKDTQ